MTDGVRPDDDDARTRAAHARLRQHDAATTPGFAAMWARAQSQAHVGGRRARVAWTLGLSAGALIAAGALVLVFRPTASSSRARATAAAPAATPLAWTFPVHDPEPLAFLLELPATARPLQASR